MTLDVSIIITNYNYAHYLSECIKSCLTQKTQFHFEVIIVDDESTDNSCAIAHPFLCSKVHLVEISNSGIEVASNTGFRMAKAGLFKS